MPTRSYKVIQPDGHESPPVDEERLLRYAEQGRVAPQMLVFDFQDGRWTQAASLPALAPAFAAGHLTSAPSAFPETHSYKLMGRNGKESPPVDEERLLRYAEQGRVAPQMLVFDFQDGRWTQAAFLPALVDLLSVANRAAPDAPPHEGVTDLGQRGDGPPGRRRLAGHRVVSVMMAICSVLSVVTALIVLGVIGYRKIAPHVATRAGDNIPQLQRYRGKSGSFTIEAPKNWTDWDLGQDNSLALLDTSSEMGIWVLDLDKEPPPYDRLAHNLTSALSKSLNASVLTGPTPIMINARPGFQSGLQKADAGGPTTLVATLIIGRRYLYWVVAMAPSSDFGQKLPLLTRILGSFREESPSEGSPRPRLPMRDARTRSAGSP